MKIEVTNLQPQIAVAIKRTALGMDKIVEVMNTDYPKLMGYLISGTLLKIGLCLDEIYMIVAF